MLKRQQRTSLLSKEAHPLKYTAHLQDDVAALREWVNQQSGMNLNCHWLGKVHQPEEDAVLMTSLNPPGGSVFRL